MGATISDETARDILAKAFLDALPPEKQQELLREAIVRLMTEKEKNSYSNPHGLTTLEKVFHEEATKQIRDLIADLLANDKQLNSQLREAATKLLSAGLTQFSEVYTVAVKQMLEKALGIRNY